MTTADAIREKLLSAAQEFVDRCERGEVRSVKTYAVFKSILQEEAVLQKQGLEKMACVVCGAIGAMQDGTECQTCKGVGYIERSAPPASLPGCPYWQFEEMSKEYGCSKQSPSIQPPCNYSMDDHCIHSKAEFDYCENAIRAGKCPTGRKMDDYADHCKSCKRTGCWFNPEMGTREQGLPLNSISVTTFIDRFGCAKQLREENK